MLRDYELAVHDGGAVLFAVMNGRLSEGINFSDDLGRAVIVIGAPYLNVHDPEVKEYVDAHLRNAERASPGRSRAHITSDYLDNACMRVVNQTIGNSFSKHWHVHSLGRAIRHVNDYAAIILIDQRYSRKNMKARLPKWIQNSLGPETEANSFPKAFKSINMVLLFSADFCLTVVVF